MSWVLLAVVLGNAVVHVQAQNSCADMGVTDSDSCTAFCGGGAGGVPSAIYLDSGTCTCIGCLFCTTCTGGPASGDGPAPVAPAPEASEVSEEAVDGSYISNASVRMGENMALVMLPVMGLMVTMMVYRKYRNGRKEYLSIPLVAEDASVQSYGTLEMEEGKPLLN